MLGKSSSRASSVMETMEQILDILEDRDQHEYLTALLHNVDPETLAKHETQGNIPKWYVDLFVVLTLLYDRGYLDSIKDSEQER